MLAIRGLTVTYDRPVLSDVDLDVRSGEILGIIGETGSGKTTLARAVVGLAPVTAGRITFDGLDLIGLRGRALRDFRRSGRLQFAFQDPLRALDPQQTVAAIIGEGLAVAGRLGRDEIAARVANALDVVGLDPALATRTPARISGGQRQRVLLARAIATSPRLLLCDEPVSALDASNRNHVLRLLDNLRREQGVTVVVISHDLSSLAGVADRVAVLYHGRIVEQGPIRDVLTDPRHPYTALLTASAPGPRGISTARFRPPPDAPPWTATGGCVYAHRCPFATRACEQVPSLDTHDDRQVACHHTITSGASA
jgi:oligopeptide/dipeptide ABC transporter ATP-binding protein